MKLYECTSLRCNNYDCDYCPKCSHAIYKGSKTINGRKYEWEFNPRHGPLFTCKAIGKAEWLPNYRHPAWKAFANWHERNTEKKLIQQG